MISWFKDRRLKNDPQKQFLVYQNRSYTIEELSLNISTIQKVFSVSKINKQDKLKDKTIIAIFRKSINSDHL